MRRPGLAVHRSIIVVDVEGFGDRRRTSMHQVAVRAGLYRVLQQAFEQAGVPWDTCDHEDRGDGVFVLAPAETPKALFVDSVPHALVAALREHNRAHSGEARIRLRLALHAGEVTYDQHGVTATAINLAFRLLDAAPLKIALAESPGVLAVITSGWFFDEVVRHTPYSDATTYLPVHVMVKETTTVAWISRPDHPFPPAPERCTDPPAKHRAESAARRVSVSTSLRGSLADEPVDELSVPRQLPLAIRDFTGRADQLTALDALLPDQPANQTAPPGAGSLGPVVITAIDGTAGVGKTALALHWAHRIQHRFPDGTLYVNLRGYGPGLPATPADILDGFLHALGCPPQRIPIGLEAQSALYRSLLARRRMLIVLDNANAPEQVRPLLPGSPGCLVLITSRASLTGLVVNEAATRLTLDLLTPGEALDLVRAILGADRVATEPQAVDELIRICARLPLALRIAAARAATRPHHSLADMVAEMDADPARLDALSTAEDDSTSVRALFDWSYHRLDTDQARLFRRLGLHPGPEMSLHAAAAVAALNLSDTRRLLDTLVDAHLVDTVGRDRFRLHDLLRAYAADRAEHEDSTEESDQARRTLLEWYAHHSRAACRALYGAISDYLPVTTLNIRRRPQVIAGAADARTWLETEQENLIAAAHQACHKLPDLAVQLCCIGWIWLYRRGAWMAMLDLSELAAAVARRSREPRWECFALLQLAEVHIWIGQWVEASAACQKGLALAQILGEPELEAWALNDIGLGYLGQGHHAEAIDYLQRALRLSPGIQGGRLEGVIETNLSTAHLGLGHYQQALANAERGLTLRRQAGDREGEKHALGQIARAHQGMGAHSEAIATCEQALNIGRDQGYPPFTAETIETLGTSLLRTGEVERTVTCWNEALEIFDRFADPRATDLRARLHALDAANYQSIKNSN